MVDMVPPHPHEMAVRVVLEVVVEDMVVMQSVVLVHQNRGLLAVLVSMDQIPLVVEEVEVHQK
jgi:hypothetical protein